jgi:hypothetical protein
MNDAQAKGRRTLILICLLFTVPIVGAMYMYHSGSAVPVTSTVKGNLITPPRLLPEQTFRKVWSLVVVSGAECDTTCLGSLENIRQIRLSLGPKMTRMQTIFLPGSPAAVRLELTGEHPKLMVVKPENSITIREFIGPFNNGQIFMVDPLGNLMMSYPAGTDMGDIRKDVAHLLKLSGIG